MNRSSAYRIFVTSIVVSAAALSAAGCAGGEREPIPTPTFDMGPIASAAVAACTDWLNKDGLMTDTRLNNCETAIERTAKFRGSWPDDIGPSVVTQTMGGPGGSSGTDWSKDLAKNLIKYAPNK